MKTFLEDIAQKVMTAHKEQLGDTTVIFPNRRAGLYFREHLKKQLDGPVWSPRIMSFQDFVAFQSTTQVADKLMLTHKLYETYSKVLKSKEGFDKFYYWGQMLLKDFDDVDKYLVNAENLYTNLSRQKQLDLTFGFLDEEQKAIIQKFWQGFDQSKSKQKERFEFVWERLHKVYAEFQKELKSEGLAYEGMQYRYVAEQIDKLPLRKMNGPIVLAGFNALNLAEEKIISWLVENKNATVFWDVDAYYLNNKNQEAGHFFRLYKSKNIFAPSFPKETPNQLVAENKDVTITGVPQHVGQAKVVGQKLGKLLREQPDVDLRKVAVVLADESLLFPVLHSLPEEVQAINVTMGFPLSYAPVNSLIEHVLDLQRLYNKQRKVFNFKPVMALLRHPLVVPHSPEAINDLADKIERENKVFLTKEDFIDEPILNAIFTYAESNLIGYLSDILLALHKEEEGGTTVETEYIHHFFQLLNRYNTLLEDANQRIDVLSFSRLFKQLARTERLPFTGEPLKGLQIMGVLETRNLDFDHVFVLSMNEDFFPSQGGKHSFIPYNLRKAYELPNFDQQDAIYAYLFYRLLQKPQHIEFFYNTEGNDLGGEEMSRFLQQLLHESPLKIKEEVLANYSEIEEVKPITIDKDQQVMQRLSRFLKTANGNPVKRLSPSALNTYLECRLRFYFRYVANLYEKDDLEDDVDARSLGNVLHYAMEFLYEDYVEQKGDPVISKEDIKSLKTLLEPSVIKAFRKQFSVPDDREFFFEGKNIIAKEIVKDFMKNILKLDAGYVPFQVVGTEKDYELDMSVGEQVVGLRGTIDRVDKKNDQVRLIDYKTGKDVHDFKEVEDFFDRENKSRNKAAFQTFYYALLYDQDRKNGEFMTPAVFNKEALFMGKDVLLKHKGTGPVLDASRYMPEYTEQLKLLLAELFDSSTPFDQTDDDKKCRFCAYKNICAR